MGLLRYTLWRLAQAIPVLIGIITITFFLANQIPGDPVEIMLGPSPAQEQVEAIRARYGLDRPAYQRFLTYLAGVATGDLGQSIYYDRPVLEMIMLRLPVTLYLTVSAFVFAIVTAIPLGVISAKRRNKPADHVSRIVSLIGVSTPSFWIGLMLIIVFAFYLGWFPARGLPVPWASPADVRGAETQLQVLRTSLYHLAMPMVALGTLQMAQITRIERSSMVESLQGEIVRKHAFQVAQLPVITIVGLGLSTALGGAVLTETVFEIQGMGRLIITAINNQDYELIMGTTFMFGVAFVVGVIITDIAYAYIDPRVAYGDET